MTKLSLALPVVALVMGISLCATSSITPATDTPPAIPIPKLLPGYPACIGENDIKSATPPYDSDVCMNTVDLVYYQFSVMGTTDKSQLVRIYMEDDTTADLYVPLSAVFYP